MTAMQGLANMALAAWKWIFGRPTASRKPTLATHAVSKALTGARGQSAVTTTKTRGLTASATRTGATLGRIGWEITLSTEQVRGLT